MNDILSETDVRAIEQILVRELEIKPDQLTADARFEEDFSADSLTMAEIMLGIEDHFDLSVPEEHWERVKTVGQLYETVVEILQQRGRCR